MKVYFALYDQSYENNAQYWTWYPDELTRQMRDAIASKSGAFQMRPKHPNQLCESDVIGGIINYQNKWCVVYRYFNGGNDLQGRPERCVLATAWVKTQEAKGNNLYALLSCPIFQYIQNQALNQCPVPKPDRLVERYCIPIQEDDPQFNVFKETPCPQIDLWAFKDPNEIECIGKTFPYLIKDGLKSLQIIQSSSEMETFSGKPLVSGVTFIPQAVEPDNRTVVPKPKRESRDSGRFTDYIFIAVFVILLVMALVFFMGRIMSARGSVSSPIAIPTAIPADNQENSHKQPERIKNEGFAYRSHNDNTHDLTMSNFQQNDTDSWNEDSNSVSQSWNDPYDNQPSENKSEKQKTKGAFDDFDLSVGNHPKNRPSLLGDDSNSYKQKQPERGQLLDVLIPDDEQLNNIGPLEE